MIVPRPNVRAVAEDPAGTAATLVRRGEAPDAAAQRVDAVVSAFARRRSLDAEINEARRKRKSGHRDPTAPSDAEKARRRAVREHISDLEAERARVSARLLSSAVDIPNSVHEDSPAAGEPPTLIREFGAKPTYDGFEPKSHLELGKSLGLFDFKRGSVVAGEKFYFLCGHGAFLELAIVNWAMRRAADLGFGASLPPDVAKAEVAAGCGFRPKKPREGAGDALASPSETYSVADSDLVLGATAEIPLAGFYANAVASASDLPRRTVAFSHSFRREAGGAGLEAQGLFRVRQFSKVEMFVACLPSESEAVLQQVVDIQSQLYEELGLHGRLIDIPADDLGAPAHRKFDIEAFMPSRGARVRGGPWGEISSASNCTDFQARLLNARYKDTGPGQSPEFLHFVNGTAAAVPRLICAILETHQQRDGSVVLPECLQEFMPGRLSVLEPVG
jgi:seryl-tRNA synthetase